MAIALAAGVVGCFARAQAKPKVNGHEMNVNAVTSIQLVTHRGAVRETMEIGLAEVRFTSENAADLVLPSLTFSWPGHYLTSSVADHLQGLRSAVLAKNDKYHNRLVLRAPDGPLVDLSWDSAAEGPDLRKTREALQRLANLRADEAKRALTLGEAARTTGSLAQAVSAFKRGLRVLGDLYWTPNSIDNTGQKLVAGRTAEDGGQMDQATAIYHNVLEDRLKGYHSRQAP